MTLSVNQLKALGELIAAVNHWDETREVPVTRAAGDARMYSAAVMCGQLEIPSEQVEVVLDGRQPMFPSSISSRGSLELAYRFAGVEQLVEHRWG